MYRGVDFYNMTQSLAGGMWGAMAKVRQNSDAPAPEPPPLLLQLRGGYAESPGWYLVQALEFDPEPINVANLRVRDIYASEGVAAALLEMMRSEGWLQRQGDGLVMTEAGRELITGRLQRTNTLLNQIPLDDWQAKTERLESLLGRIIAASLQADDPPGDMVLALFTSPRSG